jgi:hypothetical protein
MFAKICLNYFKIFVLSISVKYPFGPVEGENC